MIGMNELLIIVAVGVLVFFFGKDKLKDWLSLGKEISQDAKTTKA